MLKRLPPEIWDIIVGFIDTQEDCVALPSSHIVTEALLSCLTVCKTIGFSAQEKLYEKCLYIDSAWRLKDLLKSSVFRAIGSFDPPSTTWTGFSALYLAPFSGDTIDELEVIVDIQILFSTLHKTLKRLVINMPLRSVYPNDDAGPVVRPALRQAFQHLIAIEEFVSVRDELYLSTICPSDFIEEPNLWCQWTNLRRLALYNVDIDGFFITEIQRATKLEALVLTRADGIYEGIEKLLRNAPQSAKVYLVNSKEEFLQTTPFDEAPTIYTDVLRAKLSGRGEKTAAGSASLKFLFAEDYQTEHEPNSPSPIDICQNWIEGKALDGSLWRGQ
ncbi:Hypothetical protein R9X50_00127400 [Acrodontium crateriforme]|uniref:Uncharacterized protein n=1 Tax=Acrodontium crateriforme TaxID=150365 RepID=A0AAQ3R5P5_9PEZI|nr:Hypothetical protein R9X50_00127400 [Acrodontium crateriforme]